jgi:hypothetical protein
MGAPGTQAAVPARMDAGIRDTSQPGTPAWQSSPDWAELAGRLQRRHDASVRAV